MTESEEQQAWWDSMTASGQAAYKIHMARYRAALATYWTDCYAGRPTGDEPEPNDFW